MSMSKLLLLAAVLLPGAVQAADPVLVLDRPDGRVYGRPGQTVSWSFRLRNAATYLFVTNVAFVPDSSLGAFTDDISPHNLILGPPPHMASLHGAASFRIDPAAPLQSVVGQLVITYNLYSRSISDPAFNPDTDLIVQGASVSATARLDIVNAPVSPTPPQPRPCPTTGCGTRQ
jgi:hypothetical protein